MRCRIIPMRWTRVVCGFDPMFGWFDFGVYPCVLLEEVQQVGAR
jgi:hypothetical protein